MIRPEPSPPRNLLTITWIAVILFALPAPSSADIYRWQDDSGGLHFTDDLSSVPEKYRGQVQDILKTPPPSGKPGLSNIGGSSYPTGDTGAPPSAAEGSGADGSPSPRDTPEAQAEQLRVKIAAKEQFIEQVDAKRSATLRPLGNRFVSPEDLELYRKYSAELPGDRERLREIEAGLSPGVN